MGSLSKLFDYFVSDKSRDSSENSNLNHVFRLPTIEIFCRFVKSGNFNGGENKTQLL